MDAKEAIKRMFSLRKYLWNVSKADADACNVAIKALEKEIPLSLKTTETQLRCGRCNRQITRVNCKCPIDRCPKCGQKIDWSKEE